ncbi:F0F1 ATP synthase subunit B [Anaerolinea thermophila]|uniref:ATP synthase subunit b n=1 Tax=Anaerolinea thermophila (strain DSM 14523 / JCM 11388 / NBRC 100420 / UNI-1) TaxID=926569 RepID=E8N3S4_ANATU|nr:F0F1 ATP synthase subunit B [Anaerolinea thermophila]BAJ63088.1 ATP synthase B chain/ATP synthase delta chain [Anaerolinea thermophila UNI-1]
MEALGINLGYLLVYIFSFAVVFITLRAWVFVPLSEMMEKRRKTIAQGLEDARIAAEARANAEKEAQSILADAQQKAAEIVREATLRAQKVEEEIRAQAEAEAGKARAQVMAELEGERNRMLSELRGQVGALAIAAAQKLIGENLDEKRQHALLNEFFAGVRGGKVVVLEGIESVVADHAEIVSALPLTEEEQELVKREVLSRLGSAAAVSFRVDPSILGGLIVRLGNRVVDGSLAGQLEGLRQSLR